MGKICKWDDWWCHTLNPILYQAYKWGYLGQFAVQNIETWQADSSTGNTPMAIKNSIHMATHSFPVPTYLLIIIIIILIIIIIINVFTHHKIKTTYLMLHNYSPNKI